MTAETIYWTTLVLISLGSIAFGFSAGYPIGEIFGRAKATKEIAEEQEAA